MTLEEAKQVTVAGCRVVCGGITYLCVDSLELRYDRKQHRWILYLILLDRNRNSVTRALAEKCEIIPL